MPNRVFSHSHRIYSRYDGETLLVAADKSARLIEKNGLPSVLTASLIYKACGRLARLGML